MLDFAALRAEFNELSQITPLGSPSGQNDVFRARRGDTDVVLKLIRKANREQERIEREIAAVTKLNCDYVPQVFASGHRRVSGEERYFIIEHYIEGETYRARLPRQPKQPLGEVLRLADVLLRACSDFEALNLVHRDIKPENLIVDVSEKVWIIDFGIVRFLNLESLTPTQAHLGHFTLGYGAPEQMRNLKTKINGRADLFSVGVVLFESFHGSNPYYGGKRDHLEVLQHVTDRDLPTLTIPGDSKGVLAEFIASLVSRFPSRRPQSAKDALDCLKSIKPTLGFTPNPGSGG